MERRMYGRKLESKIQREENKLKKRENVREKVRG